MTDLLLQRVYTAKICVNSLLDLPITLLTLAQADHFVIYTPLKLLAFVLVRVIEFLLSPFYWTSLAKSISVHFYPVDVKSVIFT
jgi:hypothetical protein